MKEKLAKIFFLILVSTFFVCAAHSEKLSIFDNLGLTRASKEVKSIADVHIELSQDSNVSLKKLDESSKGLNSKSINKKVVFKNIASGSWKIGLDKREASITSVTIVK